jgi:outer membrane autotransporter protein
VDWTGLGFGGTLAGTASGSPDVNMWTFGLHSGYRIPVSPTSVITPFLNYDYTDAKLKGFTEAGLPTFNLAVDSSTSKHSWLTGGVKWAGQLGGVVPEVSLAWRHMFGDRTAGFTANFAGFADCDFDIVSAEEKRDAVMAGLSIGGKLGPADLRIGYLGAFNSDYTEHSGYLKVVVPIGSPPAPPPPPAAAPPPPPPPAPATQTCPDGSVILATDTCPAPPPPPPPPPPAPERG